MQTKTDKIRNLISIAMAFGGAILVMIVSGNAVKWVAIALILGAGILGFKDFYKNPKISITILFFIIILMVLGYVITRQ